MKHNKNYGMMLENYMYIESNSEFPYISFYILEEVLWIKYCIQIRRMIDKVDYLATSS